MTAFNSGRELFPRSHGVVELREPTDKGTK